MVKFGDLSIRLYELLRDQAETQKISLFIEKTQSILIGFSFIFAGCT